MNKEDLAIRERFIDLGGRSAQRLGFPRSLGQIYALLYLSPEPLGLQDLMDALHISKGNASMGVRQLSSLGAVRQIWKKGDRRDFYEANTDFSSLLRHALTTVIKPRLESTRNQLRDMERDLPEPPSGSGSAFMKQRIAKLAAIDKKLQRLLPLVEALLR